MKTKHTQGPWTIEYEGEEAVVCNEETLFGVARCGQHQFARVRANAALIAAAPELLAELEAAHKIIKNALAVMTPEQKTKWGELNARDDVDGEGITRANERMAVIAKTSKDIPA